MVCTFLLSGRCEKHTHTYVSACSSSTTSPWPPPPLCPPAKLCTHPSGTHKLTCNTGLPLHQSTASEDDERTLESVSPCVWLLPNWQTNKKKKERERRASERHYVYTYTLLSLPFACRSKASCLECGGGRGLRRRALSCGAAVASKTTAAAALLKSLLAMQLRTYVRTHLEREREVVTARTRFVISAFNTQLGLRRSEAREKERELTAKTCFSRERDRRENERELP